MLLFTDGLFGLRPPPQSTSGHKVDTKRTASTSSIHPTPSPLPIATATTEKSQSLADFDPKFSSFDPAISATNFFVLGAPTQRMQQAGPSQGQAAWDYFSSDLEIMDWKLGMIDTWIFRNPGTLDGVFCRPLAGLVCVRRTCHRRTSIEDSVVCAGELSPSWTAHSLATWSIEDSSI
ncbi:hypothetical protein L3X38_018482 [Prunus dulcis]|uniref:Uncharacterized protein n=1 Tax=Prunus dulcis TaxID=3755 RepID=A0AAD4W940_PRUDU|nr:hypothetical protein L3X38_018482 [Prunus dulcis]